MCSSRQQTVTTTSPAGRGCASTQFAGPAGSDPRPSGPDPSADRDRGFRTVRPPLARESVVNRCGGGWSAVADAPSAPARVRIRTRRRLPERRPANGSDCKPLSLPTLLPPRTRRLVQTTPAWSGALRRSGCSQTPILVRSRVPTRPLRTAAARRRPRRGGQRRAPAPSRVAAARPIVLMNRRSTCG